MPTVYRRGDSPYFWTGGRDSTGKRWRESTRADDKATAVKVARAIHRRRLLEAPEGQELRLSDALELLRRHKERKGVSPATLEILAEKGGRLLAVLGPDRNLSALTLMDAEAYLDLRVRQGVTLHTVQKEWGTLRSALRQAARHDLYPHDPTRIWPEALRDVYEPRERWLTVEESTRLAAALPARRRDHFTVFVHTGARYSELFRIRACDVDVAERALWVDGRKGRKDRAQRTVPLSDDAWEVVSRRMAEHPAGPLFPDTWTRSALARTLKAASRRAKLPQVDSTNDLRRTFATWLFHASVPEATTIRLMGHSSSRMVRRVYSQHSGELLRTAIDRLPALSQRDHSVTTLDARRARGARGARKKR